MQRECCLYLWIFAGDYPGSALLPGWHQRNCFNLEAVLSLFKHVSLSRPVMGVKVFSWLLWVRTSSFPYVLQYVQ
ncbi:hypothetical protein FKM82_016897 [Ascaphus truei]